MTLDKILTTLVNNGVEFGLQFVNEVGWEVWVGVTPGEVKDQEIGLSLSEVKEWLVEQMI